MLDEETGFFCDKNVRKHENYKNRFYSKYVTFRSLATDVVWIASEIFFRQKFMFNKVFKMATFIYFQLVMGSLVNVKRYFDAYAIKKIKVQPISA